jgi:26S proteasome regulatory subunit N6
MVKHFLCFFSSACPPPFVPYLTIPFLSELSSDPTIRSHLAALYDTLLEQNLLRIVEPYSVVEIAYVAETVGQERQAVEAKCATELL